MILGEKKYKLKNGEPIDVQIVNEDTIKVIYNGVCFERPASLLGKTIFCIDDDDESTNVRKKKSISSITQSVTTTVKKPAKPRRRLIEPGDTVCVKFLETNRKAVYTISVDNSDVTLTELSADEGVVGNESNIASLLIGERANSVVTINEDGKIFAVQVLSFFKKTTGIYQKLKEQVETQRLIEEQRKEEERLESIARKKMRTVKTGNTVCIEFMDTNEKQAFKIVEAWVKTSPDTAVKPYRPTSYDSKTETDANPDEDTISETSPLAKALLGKCRGDIVTYKVGLQSFEVRLIAFFDDDNWLKSHRS